MNINNLFRQCPQGSISYTVLEGETLFAISRKFNTTIDNLISLNPGINPLNIYQGLEICVPQTQQPSQPIESAPYSCPIGTSPYEIKAGDTLSKIARNFNITVETIISANPDIDPNNLRIGQQICITDKNPQQPSCQSLNTYVIQRGDALYKIASAFNVTVADILRVNPGINPNNLYPDFVICLPLAPTPLSIIINIQAKTLTLYISGRPVKTYPVATGKPTTPTPKGTFTIKNKQVDPGGPFGTRWMGLSKPHYGIHGTNNPPSIGTAASNGCVRMYNKDVEELFNQIPVNTIVRIF